MNVFEQMLDNVDVPELIAEQVSKAAINGEIAAVWDELSPHIDKIFQKSPTAAAICAVSMMVAYTGDQLADQIKFGESPEDPGKKVHPNFCIMAIAILAVNTLKASKQALEKKKSGDGNGNEEKGQDSNESGEEGSEEASSDSGST